MAKRFAGDAAVPRTRDAVQLRGGGDIRGVTVKRICRDARITQIYEVTSQIQRLPTTDASCGLRSAAQAARQVVRGTPSRLG
jgi:alkylation response protein AidB-like acyl-CoA dehydrogenase